ncbi:unnamed protein product [Caenorhabditis angaria]|uniref:Uncharacterized protein n=1 Tax=Caenorhabditis angaria TaxID=860376 RepID=A0A9P1J3I0_9PELO|nr:unnamed protein product [Caenorhabditis angaria]
MKAQRKVPIPEGLDLESENESDIEATFRQPIHHPIYELGEEVNCWIACWIASVGLLVFGLHRYMEQQDSTLSWKKAKESKKKTKKEATRRIDE